VRQSLSIEEFHELIKQWTGQPIKIIKQEMDDNDETNLELNAISYSKDTRRIDGYEPMHSLLLRGFGEVETSDHHQEPLPKATYEIPLEDSTLYTYDGIRFSLITDRGVYTIEKR